MVQSQTIHEENNTATLVGTSILKPDITYLFSSVGLKN